MGVEPGKKQNKTKNNQIQFYEFWPHFGHILDAFQESQAVQAWKNSRRPMTPPAKMQDVIVWLACNARV